MIAHRFAVAAARGDPVAMAALFAEDVTYHTPTLTADLHGKDLTLRYLGKDLTLRYLKEGTRIVDDLQYTDEASDDEGPSCSGTESSTSARSPEQQSWPARPEA
jgi:ketosteroid isomerase-like protein